MIKYFKKIFCRHDYDAKYASIASVRDGNDNLVVQTTMYKCKKCEDIIHKEEVTKVEKDWYIKEEEN